MPQTPPEVVQAALHLAGVNPEASGRSIAVALPAAPSHDTVSRALSRFAPVVDALRHVKRDEFTAAWQTVGIKALARIDQLLDGDTTLDLADALAKGRKVPSVGNEVRDLAVLGGIASEKALLFAGQPTVIGAVLHAHRVELPEALARAVRVAQLPVGPGDLVSEAPQGASAGPAGPSPGDPGAR